MADGDRYSGADLGIPGLEDAVLVGRGGFAAVYRAYQPAFRRTVAVKVVSVSQIDDLTRERFSRECQAMGLLSEHPSIVTVLDAGFLAGGRPFLVMSYMPNGSLEDRLRTRGPMSWQEATKVGVKLAGALDTAHKAGILHRDVKPANVLVSQYGEPQLSDFGIARVAGGPETTSGVITASLAYAPPEVMEGRRPTVRSDVYSLGATVYALVSGASPFRRSGESVGSLINRVLNERPPDLRSRGLPEPVWAVLERALDKSPDHRQATAADLGAALRDAEEELGLRPSELTLYAPPDETLQQMEPSEIGIATEVGNAVGVGGGAELTETASERTETAGEPTETMPASGVSDAPMVEATVAQPPAPLLRSRPWGWIGVSLLAMVAAAAALIGLTTQGDTTDSTQAALDPTFVAAPGTVAPSVDPLYAGGAPSGHEEARAKLCPDGLVNDLSNRDLSGMSFEFANLNCTDFRGAVLEGVDLGGATLWGADLTGVDLRGASLTENGAQFQAAVLVQANLSGVRLAMADFEFANLSGADFSGAAIVSGNMNGTTMRGTDFTGALLAYIALQPWTSENVALTDAVLIGSDVGVESGMWADTVCPDGEQSDEECTGSPRAAPALPPEVLCPDGLQRPAQELGTNLAGGFLACLDLSGMDLTGRVFEGASLWGVSLDGADLSGSTFAAAWLIGVDLTEAVVDGTDFGGSSWYSVDLRAVELGAALATGGAVRLVGANIAGMDLTPAGQTGFVFDIDRSSARGVIMTGMRIPGGANSDFTDAVLRDARLEGGWENTLLQNADLSGATLEGVRLASSSLENVDLSGSTFTGISWDNTTCPDGTLSNDNLGVCDV